MKLRHKYSGLCALVVSISILGSCSLGGDAITKDTYGIILKSTAMRIDPMLFAGKVAELNSGTSVQVLEKSKEKSWVGKTSGYWYKVATKEGVFGWVFGHDISIHSAQSKESLEKIASNFVEVERAQIKQYLNGKWWSVNEFSDFTDHCLELYDGGEYRSYRKGDDDHQIIGTYSIDLNKNEIIFSNGTSFSGNLDLAKRGNDYIIKKDKKDYELRFAKISIETSPVPEIKESPNKKSPPSNNGN